MLRFCLVLMAVLGLCFLCGTNANAQCNGPQCGTPGSACVNGSCNLNAQVQAFAAPLPVAATASSNAVTRSRSVARTGGPLAGLAHARAARVAARANRASSRSVTRSSSFARSAGWSRSASANSAWSGSHNFNAAAMNAPSAELLPAPPAAAPAPSASASSSAVVQ